MEKLQFSLLGREIAAAAPSVPGKVPVIYTHMRPEELFSLQIPENAALISVADADFSRDMSPWPAGRAFRGGEDFTGGAGKYLNFLTSELIPAAERQLGLEAEFRAIAGYSMAGLFAVWAFFRTDVFSRGVSASGSLWYDKFAGFMESENLCRVPDRMYFSLGDREKMTRNQRLAKVQDCTAAAAGKFSTAGAETVFEINPGGHFDDVPDRMAKGISWILR